MEYVQSRWQMFVKWYRQWVAHRRLMVPMVIAGGLLLSACASDEEVYVERPVDELYNSAMDLLLDGSFTAAAEEFDEVERQHPYSVWATKAQLKRGGRNT